MSLEVLLTLSKYLSFLSSFAVVGLLLAMSLLTVNTEGSLSPNSLALRRKASIIGLIWFFSSFTYIIATLADILGVSFTDALDMTTVRSFLSQVLIGRYLLAQTLVAFLVGFLILRLTRVIPALVLILISLVAIAAPALESHSADGGSHALATGSILLHVAGLTLWVGGLFALIFISQPPCQPTNTSATLAPRNMKSSSRSCPSPIASVPVAKRAKYAAKLALAPRLFLRAVDFMKLIIAARATPRPPKRIDSPHNRLRKKLRAQAREQAIQKRQRLDQRSRIQSRI